MDYEKLYKEALERAKEDISSGILARRETARYIFPELRESSEEMVRRTIISTLYRDDYLSTEEVNECVAWLEKQSKENMIEALRLEYEKGKSDVLQEQRKEWSEEDERIRKELIFYLGDMPEDTELRNGVTNRDVLVWLEKQGKETSWKPSKEEMDVLYGLAYITNQYDEHKEEIITRLYQDLKREFFNGSSYENMFPNTEEGVRRRSTIQVLEYARSLDTYNQYGKADIDKNIAWLEKQRYSEFELENEYWRGYDDAKFHLKEDKVTVIGAGSNSTSVSDGDNSVTSKEIVSQPTASTTFEPEFKVGNWYQCTKDFFGKGVTFDKNTAYYCAQEGCLQNEYGCHIAIVKDLYDNFKLWTIQDAKEGDILAFGTIVLIVDHLGTFENRPIIYSWYFADSNKFYGMGTSVPDRWEIEGFHPATKEQCDFLFSKMKEAGYEWDAERKELKKHSNLESIGEEWSEEDEELLRRAINAAKDAYPMTAKWLKSLKERVQPKQEWSKEDEEEFTSLIGYMSYNGMYDSINFLRRKLNR